MFFKSKEIVWSLCLLVLFSLFIPSKSMALEAENLVSESTANLDLTQPISINELQFEVNKNLTALEIQDRFNRINSTYELYEPFSPADVEFVRAYAAYANNVFDESANYETDWFTHTSSFNKNYSKYGVQVNYSGKLYFYEGIFSQKYRGNVKAKITSGSSKVKKIKVGVTCTVYGLLGKGGTYIGIIYDGEITSSTTTNKTSWQMDKEKQFGTIGALWFIMNSYVEIDTPSGTFKKHIW